MYKVYSLNLKEGDLSDFESFQHKIQPWNLKCRAPEESLIA